MARSIPSVSMPHLARGFLYALLCLALVFAWGCDSKPTPAEGESALKKHVEDKLHGLMELAAFRTTNGMDSETDGVKTYRLDYEGEFKILKPCSYNEVDGNLVLADGGSNTVQPGDILRVKGQLSFQKSESGWTLASARIEPRQVVPLAAPPAATDQNVPVAGTGKSNNIFGIGSGTPPLLGTTMLPPPSPSMARHESPGASAVVRPPVATIPEPVGPTVQAARAKLDAATVLVEKLLAKHPEYRIAKADADDAAARVDRARAEAGPGSPEVVEAARQSLDARSKLKKIFDEIAAQEPAYAAAQREFAAAQARARGTK